MNRFIDNRLKNINKFCTYMQIVKQISLYANNKYKILCVNIGFKKKKKECLFFYKILIDVSVSSTVRHKCVVHLLI